jgi:tetratricopeptide (TPR) repeat protein
MEMYAVLADILEDRSLPAESRTAFSKQYELAKSANDAYAVTASLRGLIRTSYSLKAFAEGDAWFQALIKTGSVTSDDWYFQAMRQYDRKDYRNAGDSYVQAAQASYLWNSWCRAATAYWGVTGAEDNALEAARACIKNGAGKNDSDTLLANAHHTIASILNQRGVYEEALSHAREAVGIDPNDALFQDTLAESFNSLRRFQEAINAEKQAIRLSDGKYAWMHFRLGNSYFDTENWEAARQSFEKAAQLDPKDGDAAYNVALCLVRLGFYRDAASWYEEVLHRSPNHPKRQEILSSILALRK